MQAKKCLMGQGLLLGALVLTGSTACAQSSVTLYGVMDAYLERVDNTRATSPNEPPSVSRVRMGDSGLLGPRLGFRGSEAIGGGTNIVFTLEHGFKIPTGEVADPQRFFNRQAFVGVDGRYGRFLMGRQYTSLFDAPVLITPLAYSGTYEPFSPLLGGLRNDRSLKYRLASGGMAAQVNYAFKDSATPSTAGAAWGGYVSYADANWTAALAFDQKDGANGAAGRPRDRRVALAAAYKTGPLRFSTGYRWGQVKSALGASTGRDDFYWLGLTYAPSAAWQIAAAYYFDKVKQRDGASNLKNPHQLTVQAIYSLSKRTDLYGAIAHAKHASLNLGAVSQLGVGKDSQTGVALGIRHRF